jgi:hypothetical protein
MCKKENGMKAKDSNICESCHNVTDSFSRCENCGWIRCDNCLALTDEISEHIKPCSQCPNCGSDKIVLFSHGKRV